MPAKPEAQRRIQRRANMALTLANCTNAGKTITDLAQVCGLTRPAMESVINDLIDLGWLEQTTPPDSANSLGRPATYFRSSQSNAHVLALSIGAHHLDAASYTLTGECIHETSIPLDENLEADERLNAALDLAKKTQQKSPGTTLVTAIATPGIVHEGVVTYFGGHGMPGWVGTNLTQPFNDVLSTHTIVAGDCALGARGESWKGVASGSSDVLYILAGRRTGSAAVIGGRIHGGHNGSAGIIGELPHIRWSELEEETFANDLYDGDAPQRTTLFPQAQAGDAHALRAIDEYARTLAIGSAAMILALAPEAVVIGGRFAPYAPLFLDTFEAELRQYCPFMPRILASDLEGKEILLGAARFALDAIHDRINELVANTTYFPAATAQSLWQD